MEGTAPTLSWYWPGCTSPTVTRSANSAPEEVAGLRGPAASGTASFVLAALEPCNSLGSCKVGCTEGVEGGGLVRRGVEHSRGDWDTIGQVRKYMFNSSYSLQIYRRCHGCVQCDVKQGVVMPACVQGGLAGAQSAYCECIVGK